MRIGRCLPPAAAPLTAKDILHGLVGMCRGKSELNRFENELNSYFGMKHSYLVSSGKTALTAILQALKEISPGRDEVLIPAFTCYSIPSAIIRAGLKVRLCDLAPGTFDFNYQQLSEIIRTHNNQLLCVVPVHLFGFPADVERTRKIIDDDSIFIVEDAAQAMGGGGHGEKLGTVGDVGLFSLGRGKALSTVEGGVIVTSRDDIACHLDKTVNALPDYSVSDQLALSLYGLALSILSKPSMFWLPKSLPFLRLGETIYDPYFKMKKMSPFQAGLAREWKRKLLRFGQVRLGNVQGILIELEKLGLKPSWGNQRNIPDLIRLPLWIESAAVREAVLLASEKMGLGVARTYPTSVEQIPELSSGFGAQNFPVASECAEKLVTLPIHPHVNCTNRVKIMDMLERESRI
ncbi:MAG: aminotransferase DegT [Geobacter sp.]|nr:aminotransferase DegT [Geobacter sp.]